MYMGWWGFVSCALEFVKHILYRVDSYLIKKWSRAEALAPFLNCYPCETIIFYLYPKLNF